MKKMNLKKSIVALSAAAMVMCPMALNTASTAMPVFAASASATTPFIRSNVDGSITIDESQITTSITPYLGYQPTFGKATVANKGWFTSISATVSKFLEYDSGALTLIVSGKNLTEAKLKSMDIEGEWYRNGSYFCRDTFDVSCVKKISDTSFYVVFNLDTLGDKLVLDCFTQNLENITSATVDNYCSYNTKYLQVRATTTKGDSILAKMRRSNATDAQLKAWAKRLCVYANSLKDVNDFSRGTVYLSFDDNNGYYGFYSDTQSIDGMAYTGYNQSATDEEIKSIASGKQEITWTTMHEISHAYCSDMFDRYYNYGDEVNVNVRGLTSIHHCTNLQKLNLRLGSKAADYNNILTNNSNIEDSDLMMMARQTVALGQTYSWEVLESYFDGAYASSYNSSENVSAAECLGKKLGLSKAVYTKESYLMFVNNLRTLYKACYRTSTLNNNNFVTFVQNHYGNVTLSNKQNMLKTFINGLN